ncbi:MAG: sodium:calcium antiporter, partial [Bacteroidaceae bacterium]|nr:sodium:calcium antiporter [Bacteroidaceae bacterium]
TLLAAGTSLPELATSAVAARKGSVGMAVGNVIGSNVFNVFLVLGAASLIRPMQIEGIRGLDVAFLLGSSLAVMLLAIAFRRLNRWMGILLVVAYAVYLALLIAAS